jgi:hypothetical protein
LRVTSRGLGDVYKRQVPSEAGPKEVIAGVGTPEKAPEELSHHSLPPAEDIE